jgi:hypothetical protein
MTAGPGSGGGGGGAGYTTATAGNGGSGIIIIRWLTSFSNSDINLISGITNNTDYKLGNYNGNFTIKKTINNVDTDIFNFYNAFNGYNFQGTGGMDVNGTVRSLAVSATGLIQTTGGIYSGDSITTGNSIYLNGWFSKLGNGITLWQNQTNIGTFWFIDLTSPLLYGGGNATLNIHNLVVWDSNTGSTFFAVLGFSSSYPPEAFKLSQYARNKGIQIDVGFAYNAYGNPLLYITGSSSNNQMYYRLT